MYIKLCNFTLQQYDDPNASAATILMKLKEAGFPSDYPPNKLKLGMGGGGDTYYLGYKNLKIMMSNIETVVYLICLVVILCFQGNGDVVCNILNLLSDAALAHRKFAFLKPYHRPDEYEGSGGGGVQLSQQSCSAPSTISHIFPHLAPP